MVDMLDSLLRSLAPQIPQTEQPMTAHRSFTAAQLSGITESWSAAPSDINADLAKLNTLRNRSRDLVKNNDYARRFISLLRTNVIGPNGIVLQVQAKDPGGSIDKFDSTFLENAFWDWGQKHNADVSGRLSWLSMLGLAIETVATDGECIIRKRRRGKYKYQLQFIDASKLDVNYNSDANSKKRIRMGIELDEFNAPVAYHFLTTDLVAGYDVGRRRYERVPAADIYHLYRVERVDQLRGIPWMTSSMLHLNMLGGYEDAALVAARNAASRLGFFTSADGAAPPLVDYENDGEKYTTSMPGTYDTLPAGYDFKPFESDYPHQNYGEFIKATLRGVASGLGISYHNLASDLEGVNFSSSRAGILEERETWKCIQEWFVEEFCARVYTDWLKSSLDFSNALDPLPANKFYKFDNAVWQPRRWAWVDPGKDIAASLKSVHGRLKSRSDIIREMGRDPVEVWAEIDRENQILEKITKFETADEVFENITPDTPTG